MSHRIFQDYRAKRKFTDLYEMMEDRERKEFGEQIRRFADKKIMALDDNLDCFYLTEKDVEGCFNRVKSALSGDAQADHA